MSSDEQSGRRFGNRPRRRRTGTCAYRPAALRGRHPYSEGVHTMTPRTLRTLLAAAAATGLLALTGCGSIDVSTDDAPPSPRPASSGPTTSSTQPTGEATASAAPAADDGQVPNPCELLTPADVNALTSREITQI